MNRKKRMRLQSSQEVKNQRMISKSSGSIELLGSVEGNVSCSGKLVASGNITGNTNSKEFYSDNAKITGDINCEGPVKIGNGSVIIGNLYAHSAVIAGAIKVTLMSTDL